MGDGIGTVPAGQGSRRLALTTDHPNGGPFTAYPTIIRLLMDPAYRAEMLATIHERAARRSTLRDLQRAYTLSEIAIITRAAPARILGLGAKGHLGVGADGDVAIYRPQDDKEAMFARPSYVLKGGVVIARDGAIVTPPSDATARTFFVRRRTTRPSYRISTITLPVPTRWRPKITPWPLVNLRMAGRFPVRHDRPATSHDHDYSRTRSHPPSSGFHTGRRGSWRDPAR